MRRLPQVSKYLVVPLVWTWINSSACSHPRLKRVRIRMLTGRRKIRCDGPSSGTGVKGGDSNSESFDWTKQFRGAAEADATGSHRAQTLSLNLTRPAECTHCRENRLPCTYVDEPIRKATRPG